MLWFSSSPKLFAGIDIGGSAIKVVVVEKKEGKAVLQNYALVELSGDWPRQSTDQLLAETTAYLIEIKKRLNLQNANIHAAIPTFAVFSSLLRLPRQNPKLFELAIQTEAKKFIPMPIEEINLDYKILDTPKNPADKNLKTEKLADETVKVLLTTAPKSMIARYTSLFKAASLPIAALETEAFALSRAFLGHDASTIMVVDLGSSTTDIMVFEEGVPSFNRTLDLGGQALTLQLTKQLSLPSQAAEQLKRDIGILPEAPVGTTLQTMKASPLEAIIAPVLNEIRYSYTLFERQRGRKIEKIVLTGGSSYIPNLAGRLEKMLEVRVLLGNPWARISTPPVLKAALEEIAPRMSVAAGLALRGIDEDK